MDLGVDGVEQVASTGSLPTWDRVEDLVTEAFERNRAVDAGVVASYIPVLAKADPELTA